MCPLIAFLRRTCSIIPPLGDLALPLSSCVFQAATGIVNEKIMTLLSGADEQTKGAPAVEMREAIYAAIMWCVKCAGRNGNRAFQQHYQL